MGDASHRPSILLIPTAYSQPCYNHALDEPTSYPASVHICYVTRLHVEDDTFTCASNILIQALPGMEICDGDPEMGLENRVIYLWWTTAWLAPAVLSTSTWHQVHAIIMSFQRADYYSSMEYHQENDHSNVFGAVFG